MIVIKTIELDPKSKDKIYKTYKIKTEESIDNFLKEIKANKDETGFYKTDSRTAINIDQIISIKKEIHINTGLPKIEGV